MIKVDIDIKQLKELVDAQVEERFDSFKKYGMMKIISIFIITKH